MPDHFHRPAVDRRLGDPIAGIVPGALSDRMATWNVDTSDGTVIITDAERHVVMKLLEDEDGLYDTAPDVQPRFYLMPPYDAGGTGGENDSD